MLALAVETQEHILKTVDWCIIAGFIIVSVFIGLALSKRARSSSENYFKGGGGMSWWLLGTSMAATTFAADTPLALAGWVVTKGIAQNWYWWSMVPVTMLGVFFFARLWKRANPMTDMEFVYQRYSGKPAHALRMGKALWLAIPYGCIVMGWVNKAMTVIVSIVMPDFPRIPVIDSIILAVFLGTPLSSNLDEDYRSAVGDGLFDPIEIGYNYELVNYPNPYLWTEVDKGAFADREGEVLERLGLDEQMTLNSLEGIDGLTPDLWGEAASGEAALTEVAMVEEYVIASQEVEMTSEVRPIILADGTIISYSMVEGPNASAEYTLLAGQALLGGEVFDAQHLPAPLAELSSVDFLHNTYQVCAGVNQYKILFLLFLIVIGYTAISGLWGVMVTDFIQFWIAMFGCILLAWLAVNHVGGMDAMLTRMVGIYGPEKARAMVSILPTASSGGLGMVSWTEFWLFMLIFWWSFGFTDGGSYFAQRMLSAKNERHAAMGYLWYAIAHYALRMWPWLIVGFSAAVVFPHLPFVTGGELPDGAIAEQGYVKIMVEVLGPGWLGLLIASLLAAYMSTISTQVNLGASYLMNDVYRPFIAPLREKKIQNLTGDSKFAFAESHYVRWGIIMTIVMAFMGITVSLFFNTISGAWFLLAGFNAGIGVIYILRWYWWRISAWTEITCLLSLLFTTIAFKLVGEKIDGANLRLPYNLLVTVPFSVGLALIVTSITKPTTREKLKDFYRRVQPGGPGWSDIDAEIREEDPSFHAQSPLTLKNVRAWLLSIVTVYMWLGGIGKTVVGDAMYPTLQAGNVWLELLIMGAIVAGVVRLLVGPKMAMFNFAIITVVMAFLFSMLLDPTGKVASDVPLGFLFLNRVIGIQMLVVGSFCGFLVARSFTGSRWAEAVSQKAPTS